MIKFPERMYMTVEDDLAEKLHVVNKTEIIFKKKPGTHSTYRAYRKEDSKFLGEIEF